MPRYALLLLLGLLLILGSVAAAYTQESPLNVLVNGEPLESDVPPFIKDGRTFVPPRALVEALGGDVEWDPETRTVSLSLEPGEPAGLVELSAINERLGGVEAGLAEINQLLLALDFGPYKWQTQRTHKFTVDTQQAVNDLHIEFKGSVVVGTDDEGKAGPFQDINGNGSSKLDLSNPEENAGDANDDNSALEPGDTVRLVVRSTSPKITLTQWWWTKDGKRVGPVHKP